MEQNKRVKILLIDNDEMMKIYFRDIFWIHGKSDCYDITMASSIEEAEKLVEDENTRPDTIFLDILMPVKGNSGNIPAYQMAHSLEFISKIKKDVILRKINVIILSGHKEEYLKELEKINLSIDQSHWLKLKEATKDLGIDGYLIKGELMPKEIISFTDKIHGTNN